MRAVVFDWDGTLADTLPLMFEATESVVASFGLVVTWEAYCSLWTPDWRSLYRRIGLPEGVIEEAGIRWWARYRGSEEGTLLPGAADALTRLAAAGVPMALVTAGHRENIGAQLRRHGLDGLLAVRVHGDDGLPPKPHPEPLLRAVAGLGLGGGAAGVVYAGDAPDDMRMARAAGARGVGIGSSIGDPALLVEAGADETAPSVAAWVDHVLRARV